MILVVSGFWVIPCFLELGSNLFYSDHRIKLGGRSWLVLSRVLL